jgi:hypothetical protein
VERALGAGAAAAFVAVLVATASVATASEVFAEPRFAAFFFGAASDDFALAAFAGAVLVLAVEEGEEGEGEDLLRDGALPGVFAMWQKDRSTGERRGKAGERIGVAG